MMKGLSLFFPKYVGALLGFFTYLALLFSPLSTSLNKVLHRFYVNIQLTGKVTTELPFWYLVVGGGLAIFTFCYLFQNHLSAWHKFSLLSISLILTALWSPVLAALDIVWSPMVLIISIIWSLICSLMIRRFPPEEREVASRQSADFYTVDTDI